jgi:hypothetical protein
MTFHDLPDDVLVVLLQRIPVFHVALLTGCVCKAWRISGPQRPQFWIRLAQAYNVRVPPTARGLRSEKDPRHAFLRAVKRQEELWHSETEAALTGLLQKLKRGEVHQSVLAKLFPCRTGGGGEEGREMGERKGVHSHDKSRGHSHDASKTNTSITADPYASNGVSKTNRRLFDVNHRLALHSGRSVAYVAAWMGRLKTLQRLVTHFAASLTHEDDLGFTPLAVAAWAGKKSSHVQLFSFIVYES